MSTFFFSSSISFSRTLSSLFPLFSNKGNIIYSFVYFQWGVKKYPDIALHEWIDHRVLAKRETVYLPGVIRKVEAGSVIWVEFDYCEGTMVPFTDVLNRGECESSVELNVI